MSEEEKLEEIRRVVFGQNLDNGLVTDMTELKIQQGYIHINNYVEMVIQKRKRKYVLQQKLIKELLKMELIKSIVRH